MGICALLQRYAELNRRLQKDFLTSYSCSSCSSMFIAHFNTEISKPRIDHFVYGHELHNLVKEKTCFKIIRNPICVDLILRNNAIDFHDIATVVTKLSYISKLLRKKQS